MKKTYIYISGVALIAMAASHWAIAAEGAIKSGTSTNDVVVQSCILGTFGSCSGQCVIETRTTQNCVTHTTGDCKQGEQVGPAPRTTTACTHTQHGIEFRCNTSCSVTPPSPGR